MITFSDLITSLYGKYFTISVIFDDKTFCPVLGFTSKFHNNHLDFCERSYLIPRTSIEDFTASGNQKGISKEIDFMMSDLNSIVRNHKIDEIIE